MRVLSLFSGVGLHDLGLQLSGWEIAGQVEIDPWCRAVLERHWPGLWRREDIRDVSGAAIRAELGGIDLVTGGFPCPDISSAGRGVGLLRGGRSSLWLEMLRITRDCRPAWVLAENVPALRTRGIDTVLSGLEEAGYAAWPVVVGAWAVGAPHRRERVWIIGRRVADVARGGQRGEPETERANGERTRAGGNGGLAYAGCRYNGSEGCAEQGRGAFPGWPARRGEPQYEWEPPRLTESGLGRGADGRASRLDGFRRRNRLKALGNANPPHVPYLIGKWMLEVSAAERAA